MVRKTLAVTQNVPQQTPRTSGAAPGGFDKVFAERLRFSAHATKRLENRNIQLSETDMDRLNKATECAERKGLREPLLLMDDLGLIVNVRNRTVLTAIDRGSMTDGVFTNIDGAVIVDAVS